jgi:hypothetical protein
MTKPKRLRAIKLDEVSLVDNGANQHAKVVMYKRAPESTDLSDEMNKGSGYMDSKDKMSDEQKRRVKEMMEKENMTEDEAMASVMGSTKKNDSPDNGAGSPGSTETSVNKEGDMAPEELEKRLGELETQLAAVTKAAEAEGFEVATEDGEVTLTKRAEPEMIEVEGELIEKSAVPAPMLKALERISKLEAEREREALAKRAEAELPNLAGSVDARMALIKAVDGIQDEAVRGQVIETLKAADNATRAHFIEIGKTATGDADPNDPTAEVARLAKALQEKDPSLTDAQARAAVWKSEDGKRLRAQIATH